MAYPFRVRFFIAVNAPGQVWEGRRSDMDWLSLNGYQPVPINDATAVALIMGWSGEPWELSKVPKHWREELRGELQRGVRQLRKHGT